MRLHHFHNIGNSYYYVTRQIVFAIIGIILMFIISKIDYRIYKKFYKLAYILSIIMLSLVIMPVIGSGAKGATRWLDFRFC